MSIKINEAYFPIDLCHVDFEACGNTTSRTFEIFALLPDGF